MCNSSQYRGRGTALLQYRVKVGFGEQDKFDLMNLTLLGNSIAIKGFCRKILQVPILRVSG